MLISITDLARRMTSSPEMQQLLDPAYRARITEELTREVEPVRLCDELSIEGKIDPEL